MIFVDGTACTPGCSCGNECEMPCWQRMGIAEVCGSCGCTVDTGYTPPGKQIGRVHFQRNAWGGLWVTWMRGESYESWITLTIWRPRWRLEF